MSAPIPIVRKLQADALDLNVPVSGLLRTVKLIAAKLDLKEQLIDAHILVLFELLAGSLNPSCESAPFHTVVA